MTFDMEAIQFDYSTKNIPIPSEKNYRIKLTEKAEQLCERMRWKAYFYLHPEIQHESNENYGINSKESPAQVSEFINFESRMVILVQNIKFRKQKCKFQKKLTTDTNIIKSKDLVLPRTKPLYNFFKINRILSPNFWTKT